MKQSSQPPSQVVYTMDKDLSVKRIGNCFVSQFILSNQQLPQSGANYDFIPLHHHQSIPIRPPRHKRRFVSARIVPKHQNNSCTNVSYVHCTWLNDGFTNHYPYPRKHISKKDSIEKMSLSFILNWYLHTPPLSSTTTTTTTSSACNRHNKHTHNIVKHIFNVMRDLYGWIRSHFCIVS